MPLLELHKPGQGKYTRTLTFVGVMTLVVIGSFVLSQMLANTSIYVQYGVPTAIVLGMAAFMFWMVNRPVNVDFLIATEGEMKKVSWSSRKEIIGSTKVVVITTFILAGILFSVDALFVQLLKFLH